MKEASTIARSGTDCFAEVQDAHTGRQFVEAGMSPGAPRIGSVVPGRRRGQRIPASHSYLGSTCRVPNVHGVQRRVDALTKHLKQFGSQLVCRCRKRGLEVVKFVSSMARLGACRVCVERHLDPPPSCCSFDGTLKWAWLGVAWRGVARHGFASFGTSLRFTEACEV